MPATTTIAFPGGIDESIDPRLTDPTRSVLSIVNGQHERAAAVSKTLGYIPQTRDRMLPTIGGTRTAAHRMFAHANDACTIDGHLLDVYSETVAKNVTRDRVPEPLVRRIRLPFGNGDPGKYGIATCNGYVIVAGQQLNDAGTSSDIHVTVLDQTNYTVVTSERITAAAGNGLGLSMATHGTVVWVAYYNGANTLAIKALDTATLPAGSGWSSAVTVTDWVPGGFGFFGMLHSSGSGSRVVLVYKNNSGGANSISAKTFTATPALDVSTTLAVPATVAGISVLVDSSNVVWVAYNDYAGGVGVRVIGLSNSLSTTYAVGTIIAAASMSGGGDPAMVKTASTDGILLVTDNAGIVAHKWIVSAGTVTATGSDRRWYNVFNTDCAPPWSYDGRYFLNAYLYNATDSDISTNVVVDITDGLQDFLRPVAHIGKGLTRGPAGVQFGLIGAAKYLVLNKTVVTAGSYGLDLVELDFAASTRWLPAHCGGRTVLSGGVAVAFDGQGVRELGFLMRPSKPSITSAGTGITLTNVRYIAVYEFVDSNGDIEWSATSDPSDPFTCTDDTVTVTVRTLPVSAKQDLDNTRPVRIAIYRTANGGVGPYYRVVTSATILGNLVTAATVAFADTVSDVTANARLYRDPGTIGTALSREAPPAARYVFRHQDRLVVLADDDDAVWFSSSDVTGELPWFSPAFQIPVQDAGRNIAGWSQDGRMVIAKEASLHVIDGDGPPESGGNGTEFSTPRRLPSDVGCIEPRSVCSTVLGTFFQSRRGIEILDRTFGVQWIGAPIQSTLESFPIITSAVLDSAAGNVIFTVAATETSGLPTGGGRKLIYDLTTKAWTVDNDVSASEAASACMATVGGVPVHHWCDPDGTVYRRRGTADANAYLDGPVSTLVWRSMTIETAWFAPGGVAGESKVKKVALLFKKNTDANVAVSYAVNGSDSWTLSRTYTAEELNALAEPYLEVPVGNDRVCRSIRFRIADATPTGSGTSVGIGKGHTFYGLAITYDQQDGERRREQAAR